jgi:RAB protein geranylgeranyltransferase component A
MVLHVNRSGYHGERLFPSMFFLEVWKGMKVLRVDRNGYYGERMLRQIQRCMSFIEGQRRP